MRKRIVSGLVAILCGLVPAAASACLACLDLPKESLADRANNATAVALLRPSPEDPSRYGPVAFLKGGPDLPPVPFGVSEAEAAALAADPTAVTVGVFTYGSWTLGAMGTAALGETLRAAMDAGLATPEAKVAFFAPRVTHPDPAVQEMALIELASLPYPVLRQAEVQLSRQAVSGIAVDPLRSKWAPVMIMLLATGDDPGTARFIRAAVDSLAAAGHTTDLAAWCTALIEVEGVAGIDRLKGRFLDRPEVSTATVRALAIALADHAGRRDDTGEAALAALKELGAARTETVGYLARALMDREDWSEGGRLALLLDAGRIEDPADEFFVGHYVATAEAAGG